jgi:selenocysteine-specific elongation factor
MALDYPNITLGTAGHIDHGKTALVKFLTGCDTDRLKEEKERGMSIDLGFAPCTVANVQVGIVDVPGHERFVKTMVAGASGMDGVILVVAADDGVMPQTREHLDILTLLGVQHGLVALTKADRVKPDELELVREEVRDLLQGTFLEAAPILPICNLTGEGFEPFYEALARLVHSITPKRTDGVFRLPVERAFSAAGYGTVVAGIPVSGSARIGDELALLPGDVTDRIRGIEVYGRPAEAVLAGQCAALNMRHWDHAAIARGQTVTAPGFFKPCEWYLCKLRLLPHEGLALKNGERVKFHTGTSEVVASAYLMDRGVLRPAEECVAQVRLAEPLVAGPGDRFIVRTLSPVATIGGGKVVESSPHRLKRTRTGALQDLTERAAAVGDEKAFVEYCVRRAEGLGAREAELSFRAKLPLTLLRGIVRTLAHEGKVTELAPGLYAHCESVREACQKLLDCVADFHSCVPQSPGPTREHLREAVPLPEEALAALLVLLVQEGKLAEHEGRLALPGHAVAFGEEEQRYLDLVESAFRQAGFHPPDPQQVLEGLDAPKEKLIWALRTLVEHGRLVEVAEGLLFHREDVERAREALVAYIRREGRLESVKFKYVLDTTRKYAIPLLDYFDRTGVTRRVGYTRYLP